MYGRQQCSKRFREGLGAQQACHGKYLGYACSAAGGPGAGSFSLKRKMGTGTNHARRVRFSSPCPQLSNLVCVSRVTRRSFGSRLLVGPSPFLPAAGLRLKLPCPPFYSVAPSVSRTVLVLNRNAW